MTVRDLYDAALIEINKLEAPSMLLEDYNYFINKAIQQYINKAYNRYEINQQATDDLLALKKNALLVANEYTSTGAPNEDRYYFGVLPLDYMHLLNCIVKFDKNPINQKNSCNTNNSISFAARKLTSDIYPSIINNAYFKPSYKTPYYSIATMTSEAITLEKIFNPCTENVHTQESYLEYVLNPCGTNE